MARTRGKTKKKSTRKQAKSAGWLDRLGRFFADFARGKEVEADTAANWAAIPEYAEALEEALGPEGLPTIRDACAASMADFNKNAERAYINWLQAAARGRYQ